MLLVLVVLLRVPVPPISLLVQAAGVLGGRGVERLRLNELKLVTSGKRGRAHVHQLTEAGAGRFHTELTAPRPARVTAPLGVLHGVLGALHRSLDRGGLPLHEFFAPEPEPLVRAAYRRLAARPGAPLRLSALRDSLDALPARLLDDALRRMADAPDVHLRAEEDQGSLTDADLAAALRLGGQNRHNLQIEPA